MDRLPPYSGPSLWDALVPAERHGCAGPHLQQGAAEVRSQPVRPHDAAAPSLLHSQRWRLRLHRQEPHAGHHKGGLRPDRQGQGAAREEDSVRARVEDRLALNSDPGYDSAGELAWRRYDDRDSLRVARHGAPDLRGCHGVRRVDGHGHNLRPHPRAGDSPVAQRVDKGLPRPEDQGLG